MSDIINIEANEMADNPDIVITVDSGTTPAPVILVEEQEVVPVVEITVDPNAAQAAIDAAAAAQDVLDALALMDVSNKLDKGGYEGTAQTLSDEITALANPDGITQTGAVTKTGSVLSIAPLAFAWRSLQVNYTNIAEFTTTINPAGIGMKRTDIIVTDNATGSFLKIEGEETPDISFEADVPENAFKVAYVDIDGATIIPLIPLENIANYRTKTEKGEVILNTNPYAGYFKVGDKSTFRINSGIPIVYGLIEMAGSEFYDGREFLFENTGATPVTYKHNTGIAGRKLFKFPDALDFVLNQNEKFKAKYSFNSGFLEFESTNKKITPIATPIATATVSGTVKITSEEAEPIVYTRREIDALFTGDEHCVQVADGSLSLFGIATPTTVGSPTFITGSFGGYSAVPLQTINHRSVNSASTVGSSAEFYNSTKKFVATGLGYVFTGKIRLTKAVGTAGFVGLTDSNLPIGNINPSTLLNAIGFGFDDTDTTVHFIHNDDLGVSTKTNLGFVLENANDYSFKIWNLFGENTTHIWIRNLKNGSEIYASTSTDLPSNLSGLTPHLWAGNRDTISVVNVRFSCYKIKRQY